MDHKSQLLLIALIRPAVPQSADIRLESDPKGSGLCLMARWKEDMRDITFGVVLPGDMIPTYFASPAERQRVDVEAPASIQKVFAQFKDSGMQYQIWTFDPVRWRDLKLYPLQ